ncbi:MAG: hypothetical protein ACTIJ9_15525 [Aequorivita sp.]
MREYNIHNLVSINIDDNLEETNRIHDFLGSINNDTPDTGFKILINKVTNIDLSDHREYSDGIYISPKSLIDIKYGIEVIITSDTIILNTKFRFIEWLMYMLQIALLKRDAVLIHGAAVSKEGKATLFPSWGGVGKTAILNDFVKKYDYKVIGDDLLILNSSGEVFSFPKPMVLYPYHKKLFPEIFDKSPSLIPSGLTKQVSRIVPKVKKMLSPFPRLMNFARNHNPQVKWALPSEVFGSENIENKTVVKNIFWLERSNLETSRVNTNDVLPSQILGSTINEFDQRVVLCVNVLMGLGKIDNNEYLIRWNDILEKGLSNIEKGWINVASSVSIDDIGGVVNDILENDNK